MHPNQLVVRAYLFRGARFWLALRALLTGAFLLAGADPLRLPATAIIEIIAMNVALCFLDTRRLRERALLANMGIRALDLGVLFAGPALVGELVLRLGLSTLT